MASKRESFRKIFAKESLQKLLPPNTCKSTLRKNNEGEGKTKEEAAKIYL